MANFYFMSIWPKPETKNGQLEEVMNLAIDWYRIDSKNWIIYSTSNVDKWMNRLNALVKDGGTFLVIPFDKNAVNGWMTKRFWEWFNKER